MSGSKGPQQQSGIAGVLGGVQNLGQLVQLLKPYFLPASMVQPPFAGTNAGNKSVIPVFQQTVLAMASGKLTWTFATKWNNPPVIAYGVVGAPAGTAAIYMVAAPTITAVSFQSTNGSDARFLHVIACGNPN